MKKSEDIFDRCNRISIEGAELISDGENAYPYCDGELTPSDDAGLEPTASKEPTPVGDACDDPFKCSCKEKPVYYRRGKKVRVCPKCFEKMLQKKKIED